MVSSEVIECSVCGGSECVLSPNGMSYLCSGCNGVMHISDKDSDVWTLPKSKGNASESPFPIGYFTEKSKADCNITSIERLTGACSLEMPPEIIDLLALKPYSNVLLQVQGSELTMTVMKPLEVPVGGLVMAKKSIAINKTYSTEVYKSTKGAFQQSDSYTIIYKEVVDGLLYSITVENSLSKDAVDQAINKLRAEGYSVI